MTSKEILSPLGLTQGTASKSRVQAIFKASDSGGLIQALPMVRLFPGQPEKHTTMRLRDALLWAGCKERHSHDG